MTPPVDPAPEGTSPNPQLEQDIQWLRAEAKADFDSSMTSRGAWPERVKRNERALRYERIADSLSAGLLERTALARRIQTLQAENEQLKGRVIPEGARADAVLCVCGHEAADHEDATFGCFDCDCSTWNPRTEKVAP